RAFFKRWVSFEWVRGLPARETPKHALPPVADMPDPRARRADRFERTGCWIEGVGSSLHVDGRVLAAAGGFEQSIVRQAEAVYWWGSTGWRNRPAREERSNGPASSGIARCGVPADRGPRCLGRHSGGKEERPHAR